jgi:uncharacterized protein (DUF362 family)/Pyruvate/2-oxoacid:ferredoxin oxidoreductase delta subunit
VEAAIARMWEVVAPFVQAGTRVLVKPNLLRESTPDEAVTTHPEVVRACVKKLLDAGAIVTVGDSPAFVAKLATVWRVTGIQAVCEELNVPLVALEQSGCSVFWHEGEKISLCNAALETDLILNLPKVKTHGLTLLTAAAKNLYGLVPGHVKTQLHKSHPSAQRFGALIRGISAALPQVVTIADGVVGMEGDGPSAGTPVRLGFLAASDDVFALDWHLCNVLGLPISRVPTLDGTPEPKPARGDSIDVPPLKRPRASPMSLLNKLPPFIAKSVGRLVWFRPRFSDACVRCEKCVKACPADALKLGQKLPSLDAPRCIGCCCCSEVCPVKAVAMRSSPLVRLAGW